MRIAVKRAGTDGAGGYVDVKAFEGPGRAWPRDNAGLRPPRQLHL